METYHLPVTRTARYHSLGGADSPREIWFALHGYGQLAAPFLSELEHVAGEGRRVVAPEGLSRFYLRGGSGRIGASWMTREDREAEIADQLAYLDRLQAEVTSGLADVRVGVLAFSQGTAAAGRWIVRGAARPRALVPRPRRLVLWGGGLPPDIDAAAARAALTETRVDLVAGDEDEVLPPELFERELARLRALAPDVRGHRFRGGHRLDRSLLVDLLGPPT